VGKRKRKGGYRKKISPLIKNVTEIYIEGIKVWVEVIAIFFPNFYNVIII